MKLIRLKSVAFTANSCYFHLVRVLVLSVTLAIIIPVCRDRTKVFSLNRRFTRLFGQNVG